MENKETQKPTEPTSTPVSSSSAQSGSAAKSEGTPTKSAFDGKPAGAPVMQSFNSSSKKAEGASSMKVLLVLLLMAALGVGTGYGIAALSAKPGEKSVIPNALNPNAPAKGQTFGVEDTTNYKDSAEGILKEGGIEGEGQYHLERPGGESQNVYMTSSTVDLAKFIDKKIKVWGATQTAQHAGWLMDVGRVEVL